MLGSAVDAPSYTATLLQCAVHKVSDRLVTGLFVPEKPL